MVEDACGRGRAASTSSGMILRESCAGRGGTPPPSVRFTHAKDRFTDQEEGCTEFTRRTYNNCKQLRWAVPFL